MSVRLLVALLALAVLPPAFPARTRRHNVRNPANNATDPVVVARRVWNGVHSGDRQRPFILVMQANDAMVPMINNWLCNTRHMEGVHERLVLVMSDARGYAAMRQNAHGVAVAQLASTIPELQTSQPYGSYGYWKLTELRVQTLRDMVRVGISFLNVEPDAVWIRNPLSDNDFIAAAARHEVVIASDKKGPDGPFMLTFGFLLVRSNSKTVSLFDMLQSSASAGIRGLGRHEYDDSVVGGDHSAVAAISEQMLLQKMLEKGAFDVTYSALNLCTYASGQWYDPANFQLRETCLVRHGPPVVINNNWIIGNDAKIDRAKQWGHWFVDGDGGCDDTLLARAVASGVLPPVAAG